MAYLFEEFHSDAYWKAFAERVKPHLGDLQALYKLPWQAGISGEYPEFVRSLCCEALRQTAPIEHWLLERRPSTRRPAATFDCIERFDFGFTFESLVATLHEDCFRAGFFPTSVQLGQASRKFEFFDGQELFAVISPVSFSQPAAGSDRLRSALFLKALGNGRVDQRSALNLLGDWPSSQVLRDVAVDEKFHRAVTPPTLETWISLAQSLLERAGRDAPGSDDARQLTAAIMDAPSFEALEQTIQQHASTGVYPLVLESQCHGDPWYFELYPTCEAGMPRFVELAVQAVLEMPGDWTFDGGCYSTEFSLDFRLQSESDFEAFQTDRSVTFRTLPLTDACDVSRAASKCLASMSQDQERLAGLRKVFWISRTGADRISELDRLRDQSVLHQDGYGLRVVVRGQMPTGRWTETGALSRGNLVFAFTNEFSDDLYDAGYIGATAELHVERIDAHGNVLRNTSGVSLDDGGLLYWAEGNSWVLTSGPVFNRPMGVIRGLDERSVRAIYSILKVNRGSSATQFMVDMTFGNAVFREELAELIQGDGIV